MTTPLSPPADGKRSLVSGAAGPANDRPSAGLARWLLAQAAQFVILIGQMLLVGVALAIARRQFRYRAFFAGLAVLIFGVAALAALLFVDPFNLASRRQPVLWTGTLVLATLAGFVTGKVGRRVGFWESYLAVLVATALFAIHLAKGWHVLFGFGPGQLETWSLVPDLSIGVRYLGPMWDRTVALVAVASFLLTVFGGSLAFLFFSDTRRLDARFDLEWFIGFRHLTREGRGIVSLTALVAVIGIALGVGALVAVTAVMSGYQEDVQEKLLTVNPHLVLQKYGIDFSEYADVEKKAAAVPGVLATTPYTFNEAMLSDGEQGRGVLIKGIDPTRAGRVTRVEQDLCESVPSAGHCAYFPPAEREGKLAALLRPSDGIPGLVLGAELYRKLGLPMGSLVLLTTPIGIAAARNNTPKRMEFRITGAFRCGMHEFDARLAYLDLAASQQLMGMGDTVNGVEVRVADPNTVDVLSVKVLRAIGRYPYHSQDWRELNSSIFMALNLQKIVMFLVLTFIVIVASFNIASTLFMAVVERAREIAVLKSMGARDTSIMKIFVLQGWVVGGLGTLLGVIVGLALCAGLSELSLSIAADVYMVESLKVRVWPLEVLLTVVATLVIAHLATIYPALKAARQRPVDAMRYE